MRKFLITAVFSMLVQGLAAQDYPAFPTAHGPALAAAYSSIDDFQFGIGYQFTHPDHESGFWERYQHKYFVEYLPAQESLGFSGSFAYCLLMFEGGLDIAYRLKNSADKSYFTFFPHLGLDLLYFDIALGPEFISRPFEDKSMGFKLSASFNPYVFNKGASEFTYKRR